MRDDVKNTMGFIIAAHRQKLGINEQELAERVEPRGLPGFPETENMLSGEDILNWQYSLTAPSMGQLRKLIQELQIPSALNKALYKDWKRVSLADNVDRLLETAVPLLQKFRNFKEKLPHVDELSKQFPLPVRGMASRPRQLDSIHYETESRIDGDKERMPKFLLEKGFIADAAVNDTTEQAERRAEIRGLFAEWDALHEDHKQSRGNITAMQI